MVDVIDDRTDRQAGSTKHGSADVHAGLNFDQWARRPVDHGNLA